MTAGSAAARRLQLATLIAGDLAALGVLRPRPGLLLRCAAHPSGAFALLGADSVVAAFAVAVLWLAAAWIALGLLAGLGTRLPGLGGRICTVLTTVTLPAALRRVVIGALGVGLLAGPATAAVAATPSYPVASVVSHTLRADDPKPGPSWPTSTPSHPAGHAPDRATRPDTVRVRPGDSLWLIAAHRLGHRASPERVAAYWPRVYAANRSVVGTDPGLVRPGQVLHLPDPDPS